MKKRMMIGLSVLLIAVFSSACKEVEKKEASSQKVMSEKVAGEKGSVEVEEKKEKSLTAETSSAEIEEKKVPEKVGKSEEEILKEKLASWVKEADFSKNKGFSYPFLNEEVFGERAKAFNEETKNIHEVSEEFLEGENKEAFEKDVSYKVMTNLKTGTFSLIARHLTVNGERYYRGFVADIHTAKELDYSEAIKRAGYSEEEMKKEVEEYYKTVYASVPYENLMEDEVDLELEDYLSERLSVFEESTKKDASGNPTLYSIDEEGNLALYFEFRYPGTGVFYYQPYYASKNLAERAVKNRNSFSFLARINNQADRERLKDAKIVKELNTELTGEKYYYVSCLDDVKVKITSIFYSEKTEDFVEKDILYEGELKKGEVIALDTLIPEGLPILKIEAEAEDNDSEGIKKLHYVSEIGYNGRFVLPDIEYFGGLKK